LPDVTKKDYLGSILPFYKVWGIQYNNSIFDNVETEKEVVIDDLEHLQKNIEEKKKKNILIKKRRVFGMIFKKINELFNKK
jgi:hypothetical protein